MAEPKKPSYKLVEDHIFGSAMDDEFIREAINYEARDDDLFIVTYPKCGTTWTQAIVTGILNHGKFFEDQKEYSRRNPFLEMMGTGQLDDMPRPAAIKSHFPYDLIPKNPKAKYIYVVRNPKDVCVSFYYHTRGFGLYDFKNGKFDDYFELFIKGEVDYGDYFDHVLSWWEHRDDPNVLFLTYEDMKADIKSAVIKIAEFIGPQYGAEVKENQLVLEDIINNSDFKNMKERGKKMKEARQQISKEVDMDDPNIPRWIKFKAKMFKPDPKDDEDPYKHNHYRKGIVNDWRNEMTQDQAQRLDEKFRQRFEGTGIEKLWNNKDWMDQELTMTAANKKPALKYVDGLLISAVFDDEFIREAINYKPRDDDLFIVTYLKSGTVWTQAVVTGILNHGKLIEDRTEYGRRNPYLEMFGTEPIKDMPRPAAIMSHLPYDFIPKNPKAKYIIVVRNPKDVCVSMYYHVRGMAAYDFKNGRFNDFYELFLKGEVPYGDYFDHVLSWWAHHDDPNVLFVTYEDMKADMKSAVIKIAEFIGPQYGTEVKENQFVLEDIIKHTDFNAMKAANKSMKIGSRSQQAPIDLDDPNVPRWIKMKSKLFKPDPKDDEDPYKHDHYRKGIVGDWKNEMTKDQAERLNQISKEKFEGTGIEKLWPNADWIN